jgi:hypothetical protein
MRRAWFSTTPLLNERTPLFFHVLVVRVIRPATGAGTGRTVCRRCRSFVDKIDAMIEDAAGGPRAVHGILAFSLFALFYQVLSLVRI